MIFFWVGPYPFKRFFCNLQFWEVLRSFFKKVHHFKIALKVSIENPLTLETTVDSSSSLCKKEKNVKVNTGNWTPNHINNFGHCYNFVAGGGISLWKCTLQFFATILTIFVQNYTSVTLTNHYITNNLCYLSVHTNIWE